MRRYASLFAAALLAPLLWQTQGYADDQGEPGQCYFQNRSGAELGVSPSDVVDCLEFRVCDSSAESGEGRCTRRYMDAARILYEVRNVEEEFTAGCLVYFGGDVIWSDDKTCFPADANDRMFCFAAPGMYESAALTMPSIRDLDMLKITRFEAPPEFVQYCSDYPSDALCMEREPADGGRYWEDAMNHPAFFNLSSTADGRMAEPRPDLPLFSETDLKVADQCAREHANFLGGEADVAIPTKPLHLAIIRSPEAMFRTVLIVDTPQFGNLPVVDCENERMVNLDDFIAEGNQIAFFGRENDWWAAFKLPN